MSLELERSVLSGLMNCAMQEGAEKTREAVDRSGLRPEHFAGPGHPDILATMAALLKNGRAPTAEAVADIAGGLKALKAVGGANYVAKLAMGGGLYWEHQLPGRADELKRRSAIRRCVAFFEQAATRAKAPGVKPAEVLSDARRFLDETSGAVHEYRTCAEDAYALAERLEAFASGKRDTILPTGIDALDEEVGGLRPTLTVLGGLAGVGKSALVATILGNLAARGVKCGFFGLEDGTQWVTDRLVSREALIPLSDLCVRRLHDFELESLQEGMGRVANWMGNVEKCAPDAKMKPADLVAIAKDWVINRGVRAVFVDHIGELDHGGNRERHDLSVADSLSQLRSIAIDRGVPVVVVAHLRRDYEARARGGDGRPLLSHFAESAYIERMARLALGVWAGRDENTMHVSVLKFTHGRAGGTLALPRITKAALVSSKGGKRVEITKEES
jgi:replicative DNA helicase